MERRRELARRARQQRREARRQWWAEATAWQRWRRALGILGNVLLVGVCLGTLVLWVVALTLGQP
jgi:hypothetical protein